MNEENGEWVHLDGKVKFLWSLNAILLLLVIWIILSFAIVRFNVNFLGFDSSIGPVVLFILLLLIALPYFAWIELVYKAFRYKLDKTEIRIRKGVIRTETYVVPYEKMQNVNIERSPLEKLLGLATLRIETAGSNVGESDIILPGISDYKELVSTMLSKVEVAKHAMEREEEFEKEETRIIERLTMMISNFGNKINDIEARLNRMQIEIEEMKKKREQEERKPHVEERMGLAEAGESIKRISPKIIKPKKTKERKRGGKR
ncbi:MAG: PH domain-containing protein [Candidatus Anstonellales archaeon]